jgi:tripartite ATP-independent transporter DctP family solute receptor
MLKKLMVLLILLGFSVSAQAQVVLKLSEVHKKGYPTELADEEFARLVDVYSKGKFKIEVYPDAQLGDEKVAIEQVKLGAHAFTRVSTGAMAEFSKGLGVFPIPFLFDSSAHIWKFLNSAYGQKMLTDLEPSGFVGLCYYDGGSRSFYSSKPIKKLEDLKGLKFRVIGNTQSAKMVEAIGASAAPMPMTQVFTSIQTGVVDGAENNPPSYLDWNHYQVAKYYLLDHHQRLPEVLLMSKKVWDKLSVEEQKIMKKAAADSVMFQRKKWDAYEKEALDKVKSLGAVVTEVKDLRPYQKAMKPVLDFYQNEYSDTLKAINAAPK